MSLLRKFLNSFHLLLKLLFLYSELFFQLFPLLFVPLFLICRDLIVEDGGKDVNLVIQETELVIEVTVLLLCLGDIDGLPNVLR